MPSQSPAPLVCHVTDSRFVGKDPGPIVRRIREIQVPDGNVLVENVFISERVLASPVTDPRTWPGITASTPLVDEWATRLRDMSSPLPEAYRRGLEQARYQISRSAVMMLPGESPELVGLALQMSAASVGRV